MPENNFAKELEASLREAYVKGKRCNISLPDQNHFRLSGNTQTVRLSLTKEAVISNMQDNVAAFEGWLLALKAWGCIENAELHWDTPSDEENGHYQRFLYRVTWFARLFTSWFRVAQECRANLNGSKVSEFKGSSFVNTAKGAPTCPHKSSKEAKLEKYLADSGWMASTFALNTVGRQFPVGLFKDTVSATMKVFTGGKSAIDLVGINEKTKCLWVFELKAGGNQPMGIVSELFFYVAFMRDVIDGNFKYEDDQPDFDGRLPHGELEKIEEIRGCLLAPKFHPLLDDNRVVEQLNAASWPDGINVSFCAEKLPDILAHRVSDEGDAGAGD